MQEQAAIETGIRGKSDPRLPPPTKPRRLPRFAVNSGLVLLSCLFTLALTEASLWIYSLVEGPGPAIQQVANVAPPPPPINGEFQIPPALIAREEARHSYLTMPDAWKMRSVKIPGAARAYYWQGALQVFNQTGFRRTTPFPPKKSDVYRVLVVGDSLTYGQGIEEKDTYVALLNDWFSKDYRIEFLNLGAEGYQSEDVLNAIREYVPKLKPNLVIYGICQNDFLPSGVGQYSNVDAYAVPLPHRLKTLLISHTYTGALLNDVYDGALRRLHLRSDFFDDILGNFNHYNDRFRKDVAAMNVFIGAAGLPPLVALVLDQYPHYGGRGYRISMMAEDAVRAAHAELIPTTDYYVRNNYKVMNVSRWEGHPDEVANYIWASMIANELRRRTDLQAFKR